MKFALLASLFLTVAISDAFAQRYPQPRPPRRPDYRPDRPHRFPTPRPVPMPRPAPRPSQQACFFEHDNFGGRSFCVAPGQSVVNLAQYGFNDTISSAMIPRGMRVTVYEDAHFRGQGLELYGDVYSISIYGRFWNDRISAIHVGY